MSDGDAKSRFSGNPQASMLCTGVVLLAATALFAACSGPGQVLSRSATTTQSFALSAVRWVPTHTDTFQWQLQGTVVQSVPATVYDIDMFENPASVVAALHAKHRHVICYIDVGSWEDWRPDASQYPKSILGNVYPGYPDERYVDIRQISTLGPILQRRFNLCKSKGFDAIEPDNIDTYQANTGFALTASDQLKFNLWVVQQAHARGLSVGQKNDGDQAAQLYKSFDWSLLEECFYDTSCSQFLPYISVHKVVFDVEYIEDTSQPTFLNNDCPANARAYHYYLILKRLALDSWRLPC